MAETRNPVPTETNWVVGWKQANVYVRDDLRTLHFVPIHQDGIIYTYGVDDQARCQQYEHLHGQVPDDDCRCGFNAWDELETVWVYDRSVKHNSYIYPEWAVRSLALLRVGLYGDLIDATMTIRFSGGERKYWGYRSSRQRVSDIFFEKKCDSCEDVAFGLGLVYYDLAWGWTLRPLCSTHLEEARATVSLAALSQHNDVEIHWGYPSE